MNPSDKILTSSWREPETRKPTTIRLTDPIDAAVRVFAEQMGISFNAALRVLLTEALTERGVIRQQQPAHGRETH